MSLTNFQNFSHQTTLRPWIVSSVRQCGCSLHLDSQRTQSVAFTKVNCAILKVNYFWIPSCICHQSINSPLLSLHYGSNFDPRTQWTLPQWKLSLVAAGWTHPSEGWTGCREVVSKPNSNNQTDENAYQDLTVHFYCHVTFGTFSACVLCWKLEIFVYNNNKHLY